eukprot:TRINITY_DN1746_c0_g2_i1.p2 TRINITY_DN1746_c0_g2~~TRINITY_DN1746_c0_g2_i1.p2  ORF type:complete len:101 (-),score=37.97 TRINITY_DN1746_c0_g2_i1:36-338(-)
MFRKTYFGAQGFRKDAKFLSKFKPIIDPAEEKIYIRPSRLRFEKKNFIPKLKWSRIVRDVSTEFEIAEANSKKFKIIEQNSHLSSRVLPRAININDEEEE